MRSTNIEPNGGLDWQSTLFTIGAEAAVAHKLHGPYASFHEALAVLDEEVDELATEIRRKERSMTRIREEAIQVAGIAMRIAAACEKPTDGYTIVGRDFGDEHSPGDVALSCRGWVPKNTGIGMNTLKEQSR